MNPRRLLLLLFALTFFGGVARGMFYVPETRLVPVERLTTNLEAKIAIDPRDAVALYRLARLYSMRAATGTNAIPVHAKTSELLFPFAMGDTGIPATLRGPFRGTQGPDASRWFEKSIHYYQRALKALRQSTTAENDRLILPTHLGYSWTLEQAGRTNDAIREYRKTLKLAWEQEASVSAREWWVQLKRSWDARRWLGPPDKYLGPSNSFSEETIEYLLPKLDPVRDAAEIQDLKRRQSQLFAMSRAVTPVLVPMDSQRDLDALVDPSASVPFDLDGSGLPRRWGWIRDSAAWLVWDPEGTGRITSGLQLFGNVTFWIFWRNGYEALDALDDNRDGVLSGDELAGLALWRDANGNGISDPGEVVSVREAGLTELQCHPGEHSTGIPFHPAGATFPGPDVRPTYDWMPKSEKEKSRE